MVKIRPFRVMLWSLLLIAAGGSLIVWGTRVSEGNRVTYAEMIEGMADLSQSRASQDNPPVLEIWDMGWLIMTIGVVVAIPGSILMLTSIATMLFHRLVPDKDHAAVVDEAHDEVQLGRTSHHDEDDEDEDADQDEDEHEVGEELLHRRIEISARPSPAARPAAAATPVVSHKPATPVTPAAPVDHIEPIDLVEPEPADPNTAKAGSGGSVPLISLETDPPFAEQSRSDAASAADEPETYDIQDGHEQNPHGRS